MTKGGECWNKSIEQSAPKNELYETNALFMVCFHPHPWHYGENKWDSSIMASLESKQLV